MFWPYTGEKFVFIYDYTQVKEEQILEALTKLTTEMVGRGYSLDEVTYLIYLNKLDGK